MRISLRKWKTAREECNLEISHPAIDNRSPCFSLPVSSGSGFDHAFATSLLLQLGDSERTGTMSARTGDKARHHRLRLRKLARRQRNVELQKKLAAAKLAAAVAPATA